MPPRTGDADGLAAAAEPAGAAVGAQDRIPAVAAASADGTITVWQARTGKKLPFAMSHKKSITQVAYSPNGQQLVSASEDGTIKVWTLDVVK